MKAFTIGVDYGTNSVRAVVIDCSNGQEAGASVFNYPSGHQGILLDPTDHNLARQNPADYVAGLEATVTGALVAAKAYDGFSADRVIGIGVDTTGSTPIPVNAQCVPLGMTDAFKDNLNAQAWLWKDHTAADEANAITELGFKHRPQYLAKCGETYSSEWFWSKVWHCLNVDPEVFSAAHSWLECADYIPAVLAGVTDPVKVVRGVCAAGHKCLYCDEWGGLPDKEFLAMLDPKLANLRDRLFDKAYDGATPAGDLCADWAGKLGLPEGIPLTVGT
ncbi:MAG: ribulokinase, partial [Candidatus Hydrogenedentes bacterium]|nr:ribulokinase [Candidatus Hydrogenedentota bacterium]